MGLNDTPSGERIHIGFFGRRNAGKSSVVNAFTGQDLAVVSEVKGTTTDPVSKAMELLPLGPVMIIDTPGFDDEGALGAKRVEKTRQVLRKTDIALLIVDASEGRKECDEQLIILFKEYEIPYLIVYNKIDLTEDGMNQISIKEEEKAFSLFVSAAKKINIEQLKEKTARYIKTEDSEKQLVGDLISPGDLVILVIPIDSAAPKGRLILPQQQMIRDILDSDGTAICVQETKLKETLDNLRQPPALVITDSQVFSKVAEIVSETQEITSFSILMARYKGFLNTAVKGAFFIDQLKDGDHILIAEGCTHHRQCDDIGTVKLPRWIKEYTGKNIYIDICSGREFPEDLTKYALVIHCGGCMLNEKEMRARMRYGEKSQVPITNYGTAIAYMKGILKRSINIMKNS